MEKVASKKGIATFLHRVTFIANIFFVICLMIRYTNSTTAQSLMGVVIILGWLMPPLIYMVAVGFDLMKFIKQKQGISVPVWLFTINTLFFIFQIFYFLFL